MHPSIFKEFDICLGTTETWRPGPDGNLQSTRVMEVWLRQTTTGVDARFCLPVDISSPERWVEQQVMRRFPDSNAAVELRAVYGLTRHSLKRGWDLALGDRIFLNLSEQTSNGARYWTALIRALPPVLYAAMSGCAVEYLRQLGPEVELRAVIKAVHSAWLTVLREGRGLPAHISGLIRLHLDVIGWPADKLLSMSLLEYGQFKEKAMLGERALGFLTDEDWTNALSSILECRDAQTCA